ncbi:MAG: SRPBCC family protein [Polyangiales bacterium]
MPQRHASRRLTWVTTLAYVCLACAPALAEAPATSPSSPAPAQNKRGAENERLEGLNNDDLTAIAPELARGPVALIEFADMDRDQLPAINVAVPIHASAATVTKILSEPTKFPRFMPTLDSVEIVAQHDNSIVYDWRFDIALMHMRGRNQMTIYPAPAGKPDAAARITIDSQEGDLGRGRYLFRVHPRGADSLLVVSMRLDLRKANFVARQVAKAARSVNRSANIALACSMALHTQAEAESREKRAPPAAPQPPLHKPPVDVGRLARLLNRGDLLLFEGRGQTLDQIAVLGVVAQNHARVSEVMRDANAFGSSLVPGSKAEVISKRDAVTTFDWAINLPLLGVSGQMELIDRGAELHVNATQGALEGGRWQFALLPVGADATIVNGWARFDFNNSSWLLEKLVGSDVYLGHGMIGASELMLMRAVRSRSIKPDPGTTPTPTR